MSVFSVRWSVASRHGGSVERVLPLFDVGFLRTRGLKRRRPVGTLRPADCAALTV